MVVLESDEGNCKFRVAGTERQTLMSFPDLHTRVTATNWPSSPEITVVFDDKRLWHRGHNWLFCLYCISVMCVCVWCYWWLLLETKLKGKFRPITCHEGPEGEQRYICTLSLTSALDKGGWITPRPGRFTTWKETRYWCYRRPGGPQGRSGMGLGKHLS
jgi:hypothetical protein